MWRGPSALPRKPRSRPEGSRAPRACAAQRSRPPPWLQGLRAWLERQSPNPLRTPNLRRCLVPWLSSKDAGRSLLHSRASRRRACQGSARYGPQHVCRTHWAGWGAALGTAGRGRERQAGIAPAGSFPPRPLISGGRPSPSPRFCHLGAALSALPEAAPLPGLAFPYRGRECADAEDIGAGTECGLNLFPRPPTPGWLFP